MGVKGLIDRCITLIPSFLTCGAQKKERELFATFSQFDSDTCANIGELEVTKQRERVRQKAREREIEGENLHRSLCSCSSTRKQMFPCQRFLVFSSAKVGERGWLKVTETDSHKGGGKRHLEEQMGKAIT